MLLVWDLILLRIVAGVEALFGLEIAAGFFVLGLGVVFGVYVAEVAEGAVVGMGEPVLFFYEHG